MAKIQVPDLRRIGSRYGALEADTGVPSVNLKEGVTLVHESGRDLTLSQGRFLTYTTFHAHAAAGQIQSVMDPGGALNVLGEGGSVRDRWNRNQEDLWVVGASAVINTFGGLDLTRAIMIWDPGTGGLALSSGTQPPRNVGIWQGVKTLGTIATAGSPIAEDAAESLHPSFPFLADRASTSTFRYSSTTSGAGTFEVAFWIKVWIGVRGTIPPFA